MATWSPQTLMQMLEAGKTFDPKKKNVPVAPGTLLPLPKRDFNPGSRKDYDNNRMTQVFDRLGVVDDISDGLPYSVGGDYLERAENYMFRTNQLQQQAAQARLEALRKYQLPQNFGGMSGGIPRPGLGGKVNTGSPGSALNRFIQAIAGKESGGNYRAVNPHSGALGKYQIMPSNLAGSRGWDYEALGKNISSQQFLHSRRLQEAIARYKLTQYFNKYGAAGAASAWYSGSPTKWKTSKGPQGSYPSIYNYVMSILKAAGLR